MKGFVKEYLNTKNMFDTIFSLTKLKSNKPLKIYVTQWQFRSTYGIVHHGDFYFNTGSLDGNEIIRQFLDMVISYESTCIKIFGIVDIFTSGHAVLIY